MNDEPTHAHPEGAIVVTGATGLVGRRLIASLIDDGRSARVVSRRERPEGFDAKVEVAQWDGTNLSPDALAGAHALVHLAGEPVFGGLPTAARRERIERSRVDATEAIVRSLESVPADRRPAVFVCASAVGYYGDRGDTPLPESAAPGEGFLADVCQGWERAARGAEALGIRTVRLRIGIVLAAEGGALPMMALPFRFGLGGRLGDGSQHVPWIHADDLVAMIRAAIDDASWSGAVNAVAGCATNAELTEALGSVLGRPTLLPVPGFALRAVLGELAGELLGSRRVVPEAAQSLGFRFAFSALEPALAAELNAAR